MSDQDLPRVLELLWGREQPRRGPKPAHTIHDIAAAAVRIADSVGLPGVSMNAVANRIGLTTMGLYRYVDSKEELIVATVDAAYGLPPAERATGGWRTQLQHWASANRAALRAHPWIVQVPVTGPPLAPNQLHWMDRGLCAFATTPLSEQQKLSSLLLVDMYVRGQVLLSSHLDDAGEPGPLNDREASLRYVQRLAQVVDEADFPGVRAALVSGSLQDENNFADDEFSFGLETVLDGIAARVRRQARTRPARR